jgi:23S rRNA pseudouridine2605 synthase
MARPVTSAPEAERGERIAKVIARAGLCSRREAERWIATGRVAVDGKVLAGPAVNVTRANVITVDGQTLPAPDRPRLFRYHKPQGVLTTASDPQGRPTIYHDLPKDLPRVMPVGRLDFNSEGLLLLTNDGGLKRYMELPSTGWIRRYRARVIGLTDEQSLVRLGGGVTIDGINYGPIEITLDRRPETAQGRNFWVTVALAEGKNREVRRALAHLGLTVNRLIRVAYGPFQLGDLPRNAGEEVPVRVLREQLGAAFSYVAPRPTARG